MKRFKILIVVFQQVGLNKMSFVIGLGQVPYADENDIGDTMDTTVQRNINLSTHQVNVASTWVNVICPCCIQVYLVPYANVYTSR